MQPSLRKEFFLRNISSLANCSKTSHWNGGICTAQPPAISTSAHSGQFIFRGQWNWTHREFWHISKHVHPKYAFKWCLSLVNCLLPYSTLFKVQQSEVSSNFRAVISSMKCFVQISLLPSYTMVLTFCTFTCCTDTFSLSLSLAVKMSFHFYFHLL